MNSETTLPKLTDTEVRVLGALIEKSKTTPDYYPMTLNAITVACNQKTSRKPVVDYDETTVMTALSSLKSKSLVSTAVGGTSRAVKYKHNFTTVFPVTLGELALLCLLFLRGPQTPGELNTNSARLYDFESLEEVHTALNSLMNTPDPFVIELKKRPGQKEARFMHTLGESAISEEEDEIISDHKSMNHDSLAERVTALEEELDEVKATLARLMQEVLGT